PMTTEGARFLPGTQGGTYWYGPSYSPPLNLLFVPAINWATTIKLGGPESLKHDPPKPFIGSANGFGEQDPNDQRFGHVTAVDVDSGRIVWKYDTDTSMVASVTPTAGGVVLTGDTKGNFLALDAASGKVLLKNHLGDPVGGGVVTYMLGGIQYVAVAGGMKNPIIQTDSGPHGWRSSRCPISRDDERSCRRDAASLRGRACRGGKDRRDIAGGARWRIRLDAGRLANHGHLIVNPRRRQ